MNKEVEKICAEVEQMKKRIMDGWKSPEGHISSSSRGALEALNGVLSVINSLPKTPYTDELNEASELHSSSYGRHEIMENPYSSVQFAFESGAQWKEEKLLENGIKTHFDVGLPANIYQKLKETGVNDGDELLIVKA
jgi:hypothetical protein